MWFKQKSNASRQGPQLWWQQLESESRASLPFAHLFPRPPRSRAAAPSEARQLVSELVAAEPPEAMEEIVQAYRQKPPRRWEPVESWQVVSVSRLDKAETEAWGVDGNQVVEWFDQGELMAAWPTAPVPPLELTPARRGLARAVAWLKSLILIPQPDSLELASVEH